LIFAENGRGKTTLCAILRSLQTGDAALVKGRTTLGVADPAEIKILLADDSTATFTKGGGTPPSPISRSSIPPSWPRTSIPVTLSNSITSKLYGVIVGKQGADLARQIEQLDTTSREKSAEIRDKRAAVQALSQGFTPEVFVTLRADAAIDEKITAQEKELAAVRQADQIKARVALSTVTLPALPAGLAGLLAKTIAGVAAAAERRVAAQIGAHAMHDRGQPWLSEGLSYVRGEACPFCGQGLEGIELIAAYKAYFGEGYSVLRREIAALREQVDTALSDRTIAAVERTLDQNTAAVEFWSGYCDIAAPAMAAGSGDAVRALRQAALALLDRKAASPLEPVAPDGAFTAAQTSVAGVHETAAAYNASVTGANIVIAAKKAATQAADIRTVQAELTRLQAIKTRHEPAGAAACQEFGTALTQKDTIENDKAAVRKALDEYAAQVMGQYEKTINRLLDEFQAGFRITGTASSYTGGVVSSSYKVVINDTQVELGSADTGLDKPSFRNTLGSGDKSTLALAFFLAQLDHDPDKPRRPSSLTIHLIARTGSARSISRMTSDDLRE
jgi:wobble nucleotide-excising tRNase